MTMKLVPNAGNKTAFCTTREAAHALGISVRAAQLWSESGILEAWKTEEGHRRISYGSVQRLLDPGAPPGHSAPVDAARLRILVVEDDQPLLMLYRFRIDGWKLPIDLATAADGYEALIHIGRAAPDLLITDLNMPGMDGLQMIRTLAVSPYRDAMEMIAVTGLGSHEIAERGGLPAGVRCVPKPVPFDLLRQIAQQRLEKTVAGLTRGPP